MGIECTGLPSFPYATGSNREVMLDGTTTKGFSSCWALCHRPNQSSSSSSSSFAQAIIHRPLEQLHSDEGGRRKRSSARRQCSPTSQVSFTPHPLISPTDSWSMWSVLLSIGAFGIWSEKTRWGSTLSGALVSTLTGLLASNANIIASESPIYDTVNAFLLPLSVPLLLYSADLRRVVSSTGRLLIVFCLGSVATIIGTLAAMVVVPLRSLGNDGWKIAAALMSRHIGGAINYVAVSEVFGISPSVVAAGLAADNLICAIYFMLIFALASKVPIDSASASNSVEQIEHNGKVGPRSYLVESATALALSACICAAGAYTAKSLGFQGGTITCVTGFVVLLATAFPSHIGALAPAGESSALILIQVFFAVVGAKGSIASVWNTAPSLFFFSLVQLAVHVAVILAVGRALGFDQKLILLASNANVGGPTTAAALASAKDWKALVVPGILAGIFGVAIATFVSIFLGVTVLKRIAV